MKNEKDQKIQTWLESLQRESWQLELLISGFTIFLLVQFVGILPDVFPAFNTHTNFSQPIHNAITSFLGVTLFATFALIVNLILHVFLRGFWIAAIGLRSVQKTVDYEQLNYSTYFTKKLEKKVASLDKLIIRLDTFASVVFAFAFLVVFMLASFALWVLLVSVIRLIFEIIFNYFDGEWAVFFLEYLRSFVFALVYLTGVIYLIDTLSLGFFKKYNWLSKLYYPIYKFLGWITLSTIYRSIYYSLISRFPKTKIRLLLIVFIFLLVMIPLNRLTFYKYFPDSVHSSTEMNSNHYDDTREEEERIWSASIPSEIMDSDYVPLFIRYNVDHNETLDSLCTTYTPTKTSIFVTGFHSGGIRDPYYPEEDPDKLLACLSQLYTVAINDSIYTNLDFYFYDHPNFEEKGLRTMIDIEHLARGKNVIQIKHQDLDKEKQLVEKKLAIIPFWLE